MKKYYSTREYKIRNVRTAKRSHDKQIKFRDYRKAKTKAEIGVDESDRKYNRAFQREFQGYKKLVAPENFSLITHPEEVISFINKLKDRFLDKKPVWVVLRHVKNIHYDAIVVLLSTMIRFKSQKIPFNGDFPDDHKAKKIIQDSGFIKNLYRNFKDEERYNIRPETKNSIHTHAWKRVDSELSADIIEQATITVWKDVKRCQGAQRALIELMLNTNNHAADENEESKHWWLSVNHLKSEGKVSFSFVDYGVGVFKSLENKAPGNKFFGAFEKMWDKFRHSNNAELMRLILTGELHRTVTGKDYRGKGLPGIYEAFKRNSFSNLYIITNDVYADVTTGNFQRLNCNFTGTFLYFELNDTNICSNGSN